MEVKKTNAEKKGKQFLNSQLLAGVGYSTFAYFKGEKIKENNLKKKTFKLLIFF